MTLPPFRNFLLTYFSSSFKVTFILIVFKLLGFTSNSWPWTTFLLWAPLAVALAFLGIASVLFYVGFLLGFSASFLKRIFLGTEGPEETKSEISL